MEIGLVNPIASTSFPDVPKKIGVERSKWLAEEIATLCVDLVVEMELVCSLCI